GAGVGGGVGHGKGPQERVALIRFGDVRLEGSVHHRDVDGRGECWTRCKQDGDDDRRRKDSAREEEHDDDLSRGSVRSTYHARRSDSERIEAPGSQPGEETTG